MPTKNKKEPDTITLSCAGGTRQINGHAFFQVSKTVRRNPPADGLLPLDDYDSTCILDFLPQFIENRRLSGRMSFAQLKDLFLLAKKFQLKEMTQLLETELLRLVTNDDFIVQALILAENVRLTDETATSLVRRAAAVFLSLAKNSSFRLIPPSQMCLILGECHIAVGNELQLIDAVLLWLSKQHLADYLAPLVFNMIRTASVDSSCYFRIMQRVTDLNFHEKTSRYISLLLTSKNSARVCCHENSALSRCHGVDPIPAEEKMPLSCPDDGKWIKTKKLI